MSNNAKWLKSQISFASDVLNNICLDAQMDAYKASERDMAVTHINQLGANNLFLFDRGYFSKKILKTLIDTSNQFCFRVQRKACKEVIDFVKTTDKVDEIVLINDTKVRLTKVLLETGEIEYLLSSLLDKEKYSQQALKSLYNKRWKIEEQYKDIKYAISMENFSGKSYEFVKQDFYAKILSYNLSMMLYKDESEKIANKPKRNNNKKKYKYAANKRAILSKFKQTFVKVFIKAEKVIELIIDVIHSLAKVSTPIRIGRAFPRRETAKAKVKIIRAYRCVT